MIVGLTGQIGAGKSTVAKLFGDKGAVIIDADVIGKEAINESPVLLKRLVKTFGVEILSKSSTLNTAALAKCAFADAKSTKTLNRLVHPYLLRELRQRVKGHCKKRKIVVIDAALLHYWRLDREMDITITVYAPYDIRLKRLIRRGIAREDARKRDKAQLSFAEMKRRSDIVIRNSGSRRDLHGRALAVWKQFISPGNKR